MKNQFDNWADIRVFLAVFRQGSTLAASKELGMAQPTVARRIDALEHVLGLRLFERDTRGFHPTKDAQKLLAGAEAIEAAISAFNQVIEKTRRARASPIRLTAPSVNFTPGFTAILSDFSNAHPGVGFELISTYKLVDLMADEADVAIRIALEIEDERLICRKMTTVTSALYASQSYITRRGMPCSESEFAGHSFIIADPAPKSMRVNAWLLKRIDERQIVSRCTGIETILASVKAGFGIGTLPTSLALEDETLVRCFAPPEGTEVYSWLVVSPEAYRRPEVKAFSAFFAPRFQAMFKRADADGHP